MQRLQRLQQHLLPNSTNCAKSLRAQVRECVGRFFLGGRGKDILGCVKDMGKSKLHFQTGSLSERCGNLGGIVP